MLDSASLWYSTSEIMLVSLICNLQYFQVNCQTITPFHETMNTFQQSYYNIDVV